MKTNLFSALCAIMVLMTATTLASCNNSTSAQPEAVPVQLDDEESWSLVDFGGEIIAKNAFDNTPSYVYNGTFVVKEEDGLYVHHISDPKRHSIPNHSYNSPISLRDMPSACAPERASCL